jgi:hypothetical protein
MKGIGHIDQDGENALRDACDGSVDLSHEVWGTLRGKKHLEGLEYKLHERLHDIELAQLEIQN